METWPDGKVNWVSTTKMPLRDQDGTIIGTFGISRDITARKAAEQALREQTQILQSVLDSIADGVVVTDQAGRFILVNPAAEQILGTIPTNTSPEEWIANYGFFLPDRSTPYPPNELPLLRALRGGAVDAVEVFVKTQTAPAGLWLSVDSRPLRNDGGELVGAVAAFRDVSARKRAEEALRTSEHRYRELFENANDIVYTHDLQGRMTTLNKTGEAAIGYSSSEAVGMRLEEFVAPEHLPRAKEMIRRKLAGHGSTTYELEIIAKDGRRVPLEVSTRIIYEGNHAVGVQGIARDITERRRSAEALQRQAQMLGEQAEELERRNEALSRAYAELKEAESQLIQSEKMAAIGQLVAGLAHEINNPAAFVLTHLTVIARDLDDMALYFDSCRKLEAAAHAFAPAEAEEIASLREELGIEESTEEVRSLVEAAKGGMTRIRDLVASLRSYSRIEMRGDFVMGDLNDGLRATLVLLRPIMPKGIVVELQERELPVVECNLGQINQVFMNLLVNAVQAIGEIGRINIETGRQEEGVFVSIRDNGPGIPEGIRSRIFDPFFTTKEVGKGTGLGLSISRRIIEAHHGRIEVDSQPGVGTEFRIWLPLRQSQGESGERNNEE
jgi:PAS domain S-box-containing protein